MEDLKQNTTNHCFWLPVTVCPEDAKDDCDSFKVSGSDPAKELFKVKIFYVCTVFNRQKSSFSPTIGGGAEAGGTNHLTFHIISLLKAQINCPEQFVPF